MIDALLARLATRFVFVVGKGGVGKTTTAGAIALSLADRGSPVHLISTDPAHSLGDLFGQDLGHGLPAPCVCNPGLLLEEFAARRYADQTFSRARGAMAELIERGSYLDVADGASFFDLSVPGIDEVMGALRLVELCESPAQFVIVDTAPTGHTLRLLEAAAMVESWVAAGRAMAEKAAVVASHLTGLPVRLEAEAVLDDWQDRASRFRSNVLAGSSAIIVARAGRVVEAETDRLKSRLPHHQLTVAAVLGVGRAASGSDFVVDLQEAGTGCAPLRAWPSHLHAPPAQQAPATGSSAHKRPEVRDDAAAWIRSLETKLIWVAGKGGVGKSTCASAIALALAQERRICLVSTDPAGSLSDVFGADVGREATRVEDGLYARQIDAPTELQIMRERYQAAIRDVFTQLGLQTTARLDRNVIEAFWDFAPPGIDEIVALLDILDHAAEFDALVIDSAPTGHFLRLLELPAVALDWVHALMRVLLKYSAVADLDALGGDLLGFAKRLRQLRMDLSSPDTTAVFVVTLGQPVVKAETARLSSALERSGIGRAATILNRAAAPDPPGGRRKHRIADNGTRTVRDVGSGRWIRAPDLHAEIIGPAALRDFLEQWELNGD